MHYTSLAFVHQLSIGDPGKCQVIVDQLSTKLDTIYGQGQIDGYNLEKIENDDQACLDFSLVPYNYEAVTKDAYPFVLVLVTPNGRLDVAHYMASHHCLLIQQDQDAEKKHNRHANVILEIIKAAGNGKIDRVRQLIAEGRNVNIRGYDKETALHEAIGYPELVKLLLEAGADHDIEDVHFNYPINLAVWRNQYESIALLIEHGADVNVSGKNGTPLEEAVINNNTKIVALLLNAGAVIDDEEGVIINRAVQNENAAIVGQLLKAGASPNTIYWTSPPQAPLTTAKEKNNSELIRILSDYGAKEMDAILKDL